MRYNVLSVFIILIYIIGINPEVISAQVANTPWATSYHDMKRTGRTTAIGPSNPKVKWRLNFTDRFGINTSSKKGATIGVDGNTIFIAGAFEGLWAVDKNTGTVKWKRFAEQGIRENPWDSSQCPGPPWSNEKWIGQPPTVGADGTLYVTTEYGYPMALNPTNGAIKWYVKGCKTEQATAMDNTAIYFGSWDGWFYAFKTYAGGEGGNETGERLKWKYQFKVNTDPLHWSSQLYTYGAPAIGDDGTIYFAWRGIHAFHPTPQCTIITQHCPAQRKWYTSVPDDLFNANPFYGPAIGPDGTLYIVHKNTLFAISSTGQRKWSLNTPSNIVRRHPSVALDGTIYIGTDDGYLRAINTSGVEKWKFHAGCTGIMSYPIIDGNGTIYFMSNCDAGKGRLYAINPNGTEKWRLNTGDTPPKNLQGNKDLLPSMDSDGTIYVPTGWSQLSAISQDGPTSTPTTIPTITPIPTRTPTATWTPTPPFTLLGDIVGGGPNSLSPDGRVDISDFTVLIGELYKPAPQGGYKADLIGTTPPSYIPDGVVDINDFTALLSNFSP